MEKFSSFLNAALFKKSISVLLLAIFFSFVFNARVSAFSCSSNGTGGGNFNVAATWVGCNGITPQAIDSITINSGDTVTLVATTTVAGIAITNGGILAANTRAIINTGGYINNGSHTGTTSTMTLSGIAGTIVDGAGSYTPTGIVTISIGSKTVASGSQLSFDKITVTVVTLTNNSTAGLTVVSALAGTGRLTQGASSILNIGGTSAITSLDASASPNEVHYTSTAANQTIKAPISVYHHLFIDKSGRIGTLAGATTVNGDLSVTAGTLADGGNQITGNATGTLSLSAGTTLTLGLAAAVTTFPTAFTTFSISTTSTVNYNATSAQTISNVLTYGNLTLTGASVTKTAAGAITVNGNFTNTTATGIVADDGFTITVKGNSTMTGMHTGTGEILFSGGSAAHSVAGTGSYNNVELDDSNGVTQTGTTNIGGTFTITSGTWSPAGTTLAVTGDSSITGTLSISSTTGAKTLSGNVTVNSGGTISLSAAETLTIGGNLTISSGAAMTFSAAGIIPLSGNLTVNGTGTITGTTGLWTFQKVGGGTIGGTVASLTISGNVTFATQYTISYPFAVNSFTVNTGITETNTSTVTINGTLGGLGTFIQNSSTTLSVRSISITTLNATAAGNIVHFIGGVAGTIKGTSYVDLDINKSSGFTATANGTVNVTGNLTVTSGTISLASSTFTVTGTTDIYDTLTDTSGGVAGGNNVFQGLVTLHPGAIWLGIVGEVCDFHFEGSLVVNGASFTSSTGIYYFETNNQSITGSSSFTIDNLSVISIQLTNSSTGTLTISKVLAGTGELIQDTNAVLNIGGTSTITTLTPTGIGNTVNYNGTAAQTVHAGAYRTLTVNGNTTGSVDISANTTANTTLTLGATKLSTGSNKMILGLSASVTRTSGYVIGMIEKLFNTSASFSFDIGDAGTYTPIDLTLLGVTGTGSIDASVTSTDNTDIANSGIDSAKSVNRYFTLANNGLVFTSYIPVFHFVSADVDSGVNVTDMTIAKRNSGSWSIVSSTCTAISCNTVGLTSMSEFQIGVPLPSGNSSSSNSDSSSPIVPLLEAVLPPQLKLPTSLLFNSQPAETTEKPALFDIVSSPLFPNTGNASLFAGLGNVTIFPVAVSIAVLIGMSGYILFIAYHRRRRHIRRRWSRVLRIARGQQRYI